VLSATFAIAALMTCGSTCTTPPCNHRRRLTTLLWRVVPAVTFGALIAVVATRAIRHLLFGVELLDPMTYLAVIVLVFAVVTAASWLPAHRAAGVDPLALLRRQ
jgi:ABC-type antimicrobial peptide transport system permease subunit